MSDYNITIVHLFPDLLNLYGDKGNIECLRKRLEWRGVDVNIVNITNDCEDIDFSEADIVFLGGGYDREEALATCQRALDEIVVKGVKTTIPFQRRILSHRNFVEGRYDTGFVENVLQKISKSTTKEKAK